MQNRARSGAQGDYHEHTIDNRILACYPSDTNLTAFSVSAGTAVLFSTAMKKRGAVFINELKSVRYYIGAIKRANRNKKSERLYADQQKLLAHLQRQDIKAVLGHLIQHPDKTVHEKGVDVRLAVEMIRFARENQYDVAYLISSDTDLVAAVEEVQSLGKAVQYVSIPKEQSFSLTKTADDVRLLRPEDVRQFMPPALL